MWVPTRNYQISTQVRLLILDFLSHLCFLTKSKVLCCRNHLQYLLGMYYQMKKPLNNVLPKFSIKLLTITTFQRKHIHWL